MFLLIVSVSCVEAVYGHITYSRHDSLKVVSLLREGQKYYVGKKEDKKNGKRVGKVLMLFYGHKLKGIPYVAHTLEVNKAEQLVVNMRQMDCTTFTETVLALSRTTVQGSVQWADFCANLRLIRYEGGKIDGYPSRNHYFFWWVESNRKLGAITTPMDKSKWVLNKEHQKISKKQTIFLDWMSTHSSPYSMLNGNMQYINEISQHEKQSDGKSIMYIPKNLLNLNSQLRFIENGDILALCTNKKGLDTTHIGIAEWGSDGNLHLLNASQIRHKVVLESMTLFQYMKQHPVQMGIWVIKPVL